MRQNYWSLHALEPILAAREARTLQLESNLCLLQLEKAHKQLWRPSTAKNKWIKKINSVSNEDQLYY